MSTFSAPGHEAHRIKSEQALLIKDHLIEPVRVLARPRPTDIVAVIVARNEALRLPDCLSHYRRLGVKRFAVIDNGSTDESQDFLLTQPDVDVFYIHSGYPQARSGCYWCIRLFDQYGFNRWYISVDADELLVYDGMEKHDIYDLAANLTHRGAKSLFAPMIDMYADRPFYELSYRPGDSMIATCQFFDGDSYALTPLPQGIPWITGGPRDRITPGASDADLHNLSKFPFFFWDETSYRLHNHHFSASGDRPFTGGALLHFKMLPDFSQKIDEAIEEKTHWKNAEFYHRYKSGIDDGRLISPLYEGSRHYEGPITLIKCGLMSPIDWPHIRKPGAISRALAAVSRWRR